MHTHSRVSWTRRSALAVIGLLLVGCGRESKSTAFSSPSATVAPVIVTPAPTLCSSLEGTVARVRLENFRFVPQCWTMRMNQGLSLHNAGDVTHNFSVPNTLVDLDTRPGADTNSEAIGGVVRPGEYQFFCKYHRTRGMTGTLRVLPP